MVKSILTSCLVVALAGLVLGGEGPAKDLATITRNAIHTTRFLKVEVETQLFALIKSKSSEATKDEQKECISKVKTEAVDESQTILASTIGNVMLELSKAGESMANGDKDKVQQWLEKYDYEGEKDKAKKDCKQQVKALLPKVEGKLDECLKA